jgi:hypothetical protein
MALKSQVEAPLRGASRHLHTENPQRNRFRAAARGNFYTTFPGFKMLSGSIAPFNARINFIAAGSLN